MSRDRLVTEQSEFEEKVESLVNKLLTDIALASEDGDEYQDGIAQATLMLLDEGVLMEDGAGLDEDLFDDIDDLDEDDGWDLADDDLFFDPWHIVDNDEDHGP